MHVCNSTATIKKKKNSRRQNRKVKVDVRHTNDSTCLRFKIKQQQTNKYRHTSNALTHTKMLIEKLDPPN